MRYRFSGLRRADILDSTFLRDGRSQGLPFNCKLESHHCNCSDGRNDIDVFFAELFFSFRNEFFEYHPEHSSCCQPEARRQELFKYQYEKKCRNRHQWLWKTAEYAPESCFPHTCTPGN